MCIRLPRIRVSVLNLFSKGGVGGALPCTLSAAVKLCGDVWCCCGWPQPFPLTCNVVRATCGSMGCILAAVSWLPAEIDFGELGSVRDPDTQRTATQQSARHWTWLMVALVFILGNSVKTVAYNRQWESEFVVCMTSLACSCVMV